ncbi:MAG: hypothetical protein WCB68_04490, partial [Pyrinomonadaceae bacterium]
PDSAPLLDKLQNIVEKIQPQFLMKGIPYDLLQRRFVIKPSLLSDSVAISLQYKDNAYKKEVKGNKKGKKSINNKREKRKDKKREKSYLVWLICASTIKILDLYLEDEPSMVLRGCITYGELDHKENFIVGPAVDVAAENMEVCQGAFVWLHPEAAAMYRYAVEVQQETIKLLYAKKRRTKLLEGSKLSLAEPLIVDQYNMPLKGGGRLLCPVINPLAFHKTEKKRQAVIKAYQKTLTDNHLDVMLKQQYTLEFLKEANKAREEHSIWYKKFINSL